VHGYSITFIGLPLAQFINTQNVCTNNHVTMMAMYMYYIYICVVILVAEVNVAGESQPLSNSALEGINKGTCKVPFHL
jgi:hypothetical protein